MRKIGRGEVGPPPGMLKYLLLRHTTNIINELRVKRAVMVKLALERNFGVLRN